VKLYFIEHTESGEIKLHSCLMKDRVELWKQFPNAKEIPTKTYNKLQEIMSKINKDDTTVR
jgi:hypothetical protein